MRRGLKAEIAELIALPSNLGIWIPADGRAQGVGKFLAIDGHPGAVTHFGLEIGDEAIGFERQLQRLIVR